MIERIAILGTGLLGTSAGLALRAAGFRGAITGWNRSAEQARLSLSMRAIDSVAADPLQAARESDVTILCVPIYATLDFMEKLACVLGSEHMVTDVGSTKRLISEAAGRLFNKQDRAAFLPGHPMAGKERGGAALGDAELFRGAVWLFTDDLEVERSAHSAELVAWVSHLPQFVATALSALLEEKVGDAPELKDVGGRGLREMTRLGASPYSMWRDIAYTNTAAVDAALQALELRLAHLRENLRTPELRDEFERANKFRKE